VKHLYVLFDAECALCCRCRDWIMRQPAYLPLYFIPLQSPDIAQRFPGIEALKPNEQLLLISDGGAVYRGASAWIICLWALRKYRLHAQRLAAPVLLPFARTVCESLSRNRFFMSQLLFNEDESIVARQLAAHVSRPSRQCSTARSAV
jgi:predicted DCC family thiol-disulfide oxidoreductase YuxK